MTKHIYECGCERGGDCTKTTMCAIQSAIEDKDTEIERLERLYGGVKNDMRDAGKVIASQQAEIERLRDALRTVYTWNASGDYQRDLFRMKDFAIAALEGEK